MRRVGGTLLVLALAWTAACAREPERATPAAMVAAADALDAAYVAAFNRGDIDAIDALYWNSGETISFPSDVMEARGIGAIREANARAVASARGAQLTIVEAHNLPVGDAVVGWGRWRLTPPGGATPVEGRYTDVKAERGGRWVYILDHASVPER